MMIIAAALPILLVLLGFLRGFTSWQIGLLTLLATGAEASAFFHISFPTMGQAVEAALFPALWRPAQPGYESRYWCCQRGKW